VVTTRFYELRLTFAKYISREKYLPMINLARFSYSKIENKFNCKQQSFPDVTQCWKYQCLYTIYYTYTNVYRDVALQDVAFLIINPAGRGLKVLNK